MARPPHHEAFGYQLGNRCRRRQTQRRSHHQGMAHRQTASGEVYSMKSCKVIRGGENFLGKQGLNYFSGISAESANADAICMHLLVMPPGASAKPHYHESHETAIYMLEGITELLHGPNFEFK